MDSFVLANGYNSLGTVNCGALNCRRAFWSTKDGGKTPNFFVITGVGIADIQSGQHADGLNISGTGEITLTGLSITKVKQAAIRIASAFTGILSFSGVTQDHANHGLRDEGSAGVIVGNGIFHNNFAMAVDVSRNKRPETCIQRHGSTPFPFNPTPTVPASGVAVQNHIGTNCMVYLAGKNINDVTVAGTHLPVQGIVYLPVKHSVTIKYSGELSWTWQRIT